MKIYSDPTANMAIGSVEREFKAKQKLAKQLKELRRKGMLSDEKVKEARKLFTGIFSHLFEEIFED